MYHIYISIDQSHSHYGSTQPYPQDTHTTISDKSTLPEYPVHKSVHFFGSILPSISHTGIQQQVSGAHKMPWSHMIGEHGVQAWSAPSISDAVVVFF